MLAAGLVVAPAPRVVQGPYCFIFHLGQMRCFEAFSLSRETLPRGSPSSSTPIASSDAPPCPARVWPTRARLAHELLAVDPPTPATCKPARPISAPGIALPGMDLSPPLAVRRKRTGATRPAPPLPGLPGGPTGRFGYVANRTSNSVTAYSIDGTTGALMQVAGSPFPAGSLPMSVTVNPTGRFAYVANFGSHDVSAYTINGTTGALVPLTGSPLPSGSYPRSVTTASGPPIL